MSWSARYWGGRGSCQHPPVAPEEPDASRQDTYLYISWWVHTYGHVQYTYNGQHDLVCGTFSKTERSDTYIHTQYIHTYVQYIHTYRQTDRQ